MREECVDKAVPGIAHHVGAESKERTLNAAAQVERLCNTLV